MAAQAGLVLRNVRLIEDLRESRRRIVSAQDERARALERNIHDGAQQQLVALSVKLRLAERHGATAIPRRRERRPRGSPGAHGGDARGPPRPRSRHLPAAARRQGTARGARGAGEEVVRPGHRRSPTASVATVRGRGVRRVLLLPRGAEQRREVRRCVDGRDPPRPRERRAPIRRDRRRPRLRSGVDRITGPGCRGWPTAWTRSADRSRSTALPARGRGWSDDSRSTEVRDDAPMAVGAVGPDGAPDRGHVPAGRAPRFVLGGSVLPERGDRDDRRLRDDRRADRHPHRPEPDRLAPDDDRGRVPPRGVHGRIPARTHSRGDRTTTRPPCSPRGSRTGSSRSSRSRSPGSSCSSPTGSSPRADGSRS